MNLIRSSLFLAALIIAPVIGQAHFDTRGFQSLFDGTSLDGWVTAGGRYDGHANWKVENGAIVGSEGPNHAGGLLYTEARYRNFIISLDAWVSHPFDSGIFCRMAPKGRGAQVTLDYRPNGEVGAIYSDGYLHHNREAKANFKRDAWNRFEVRCTGDDMRLEVWMNGKLITDYSVKRGSKGFAPQGLIGLQVHGNRNDPKGSHVRFRNIMIRELPEFDSRVFSSDDKGNLTLTSTGRKQGWENLLSKNSLDGWEWTGTKEGYVVKDGHLIFPDKGGNGHIFTKKDYQDFEYRMDFRVTRLANSGLFLRAARDGSNPAYSGCEVQILDDFNWEKATNSKLKAAQFTGSLYGSTAAGDHGVLNPPGRWNTYDIRYVGTQISVRLNGHLLYDVDTLTVPGKAFAKRARAGFIGLQRHSPAKHTGLERARFRNIFVRPVTPGKAK